MQLTHTHDDKGEEHHGVQVTMSLAQLDVAVSSLLAPSTRRPSACIHVTISAQRLCSIMSNKMATLWLSLDMSELEVKAKFSLVLVY